MKASAIINAVEGVTQKWTKQRKREERERSARRNRANVMIRRRTVTVRDAAWQIMSTAYLKASANGALPAHARQIMYAARPHIQATSDRDLGARFDQYFTQQLLPEYIEEMRVAWNVVYDARGHFQEPHTRREIPLGTLAVRDTTCATSVSTCGQRFNSSFPTSTSRPSVRAIVTAPCSSSRRKASCPCSGP